MTTKVRYIGLDVHKETIVIAIAEKGGAVCYEAGPMGYSIHRRRLICQRSYATLAQE